MARVTCRAGRWQVAFPAPQPAVLAKPGREDTLVGIDRGVATTLALSDGVMLRVPIMRVREQKQLVKLQQQLARCRKGSAPRATVKARIAGLRQRVGRVLARSSLESGFEPQDLRELLGFDHPASGTQNVGVSHCVGEGAYRLQQSGMPRHQHRKPQEPSGIRVRRVWPQRSRGHSSGCDDPRPGRRARAHLRTGGNTHLHGCARASEKTLCRPRGIGIPRP